MGNLEPGFMNKNPASGRWSVTGRIVQSERGRGVDWGSGCNNNNTSSNDSRHS